MSKVCTGEAGYIGKVSPCENGSVTPAAPPDSEYEAWLDRLDNEFSEVTSRSAANEKTEGNSLHRG